MVREGDLLVELVEAQSKKRFKEHVTKDGEAYVEVEPGVEYLARIKKSCRTPQDHDLLLFIFVDGKCLDYGIHYKRHETGDAYYGRWFLSRSGASTTEALKFSQAVFRGPRGPGGKVGGNVVVKVYERIEVGKTVASNKSFRSPRVGFRQQTSGMAKALCSTEGTTKFTEPYDPQPRCKKGKLLNTITLNYCSAVGLIAAGVLQKPSNTWDNFRRFHRATASSNRHAVDVVPVTETVTETTSGGKRLRRDIEILDLIPALEAEEAAEDDSADGE